MNRLVARYSLIGIGSRNLRELSFKTVGYDPSYDNKFSEDWQKSSRFSPNNVETREEELDRICNLLRERANWDTLDVRFGALDLSKNLVDGVLIRLREPSNAKRSLSFFHWCSQRKKHDHGARSYCLMIHILVQAGLTLDARALLESILLKNSDSDASLLAVVETLLCTYEAVHSGPRVFDLLVQTCSRLRLFYMAFRVCTYLEEHGFLPNLISFNTLLHTVQRSDQTDLIWEIYEFMVFKRIYPNQFTVEIMTNSMCKRGTLLKVVNTLDMIHSKRCSPTVIINTALVLRIIEQDRTEEAILLARRMLQKNLILDDVARSLIILAHCKFGNLKLAHDLHDDLLKRGHPMNAFACTALLELLCREEKTEEATLLLHQMLLAGLNPYEDTYNILIQFFSKLGRSKDALKFCRRMVERGFLPSGGAAAAVFSRLCEGSHMESADWLLTFLLEKGFVPGESIYCDLIDGFGRAGKYQAVLRLFHEVEWRGISTSVLLCSSVVRSLRLCGKSMEAEKILARMQLKSTALATEISELMII